ncbi:hypothetical protein JCM31826_01950 [Thermaurantimonas aggregans]|uniref:Trigger factor ribosome-binding bacterial domain-containing protein n=1 Tax=Thermaurantimonas aggregans TaxID=2173829 RepID=A0A401XI86_9FLAO|nr:trigger factor [Thermaurantimonas aggregans]MCX8149316.1 trigger factor family protein [Thermaurantimonas aggregans]GCD76713.1 hypothetical protein JCM31826_01950 [Thermaurantimonas aggregans]
MEVILTELAENHKKITVTVSKEEFLSERKKAIKKYQKTAVVPGFRPGTAPESLIVKMYGDSFGINETYEKAYKAFEEEVAKNQFKLLLDPVAEFSPEANFSTGENVTVNFEFGTEPEVQIEITEIVSEPLYAVQLTEQEVDEEIARLKNENKNVIEANSLDEAEAFEIITHTHGHDGNQEPEHSVTYISKSDITDDKLQEFVEKFQQKDEHINVFDYLLNPEDKKFDNLRSSHHFHLGRMVKFEEIDELTLAKKIVPSKTFENPEEFKQFLKKDFEEQYNELSKDIFLKKAFEFVRSKITNLPMDFLAKWWNSYEKNKNNTPFETISGSLVWELTNSLINKTLARLLDLQVSWENVIDFYTEQYTKTLPEDQLETMKPLMKNYVEGMLKDKKRAEQMFDRTYEYMLKNALVSHKTNPFTVTLTQFREILSNIN